MSVKEFVPRYFCICEQAYEKKSQIRKHVSICKHVRSMGNQCIFNTAKKDLLQLAISKSEIQPVNCEQSIIKDQTVVQFKCGCEKHFRSKGGYYRHIKKCKLRPEQQIVTGKTKCKEPGCLLTFKYIRDFRQHLTEKHKIKFDVDNKQFNRYSDFLCWKENYEAETRSCFYHRKTETRSGRRVEYWYCNRSGIYQSVSQGRRRKLKSQGILKINNNCTSSITLTINEIESTVQAVIYHTHYGHEAELVHLRIPKSDKQEIASKLLQGVKIEDILLSYKEDGSSKKIERKHLIKRRDILNISKKYNVNIILPKVRKPSKEKKNVQLIQKTVEPLHVNDFSLNTIETKKRHNIASQLSLSIVKPIYDNIWRITLENNLDPTYSLNNFEYHVTKNDVTCCSSNCKAYCSNCNVCYHSYTCTCSDFSSKIIICEHVHLVVLFQVTPQTYQYEGTVVRSLCNNQDHTSYTQNSTESNCSTQLTDSILTNEDVSNNIEHLKNKQNVKLKSLKIKLEKLMSNMIHKVSECNNLNLLDSVERQMTDVLCDLDMDLSKNKKRSNETQTIITPEKNIEVYYVF